MAVWITILRFMGDLPEPKYITSQPDAKVTSNFAMLKLRKTKTTTTTKIKAVV